MITYKIYFYDTVTAECYERIEESELEFDDFMISFDVPEDAIAIAVEYCVDEHYTQKQNYIRSSLIRMNYFVTLKPSDKITDPFQFLEYISNKHEAELQSVFEGTLLTTVVKHADIELDFHDSDDEFNRFTDRVNYSIVDPVDKTLIFTDRVRSTQHADYIVNFIKSFDPMSV